MPPQSPVCGAAQIAYQLPPSSRAQVAILDPTGRIVWRWHDDRPEAGWRAAQWDLRDDRGRGVPSGTYLVRVTTARDAAAARMVVVR